MKTKISLLVIVLINCLNVSIVKGQCGYALHFNEMDKSYVWALDYPAIDDNFTMEFWVKPGKEIKPNMTEGYSGYTGTNGQSYAIWPNWYPTTTYEAGAGVSVGTNGVAVFEHAINYLPAKLVHYTPIPSNSWTHIAVVYTNKTPTLFINGVYAKTGLTSNRPKVHPSSSLGDPSHRNYGAFDGSIDELRVWDASLSASTISVWYNQVVLPSHPNYSSLNTYWKLDEGAGTLVSDASGNGHGGDLEEEGYLPTWTSDTWIDDLNLAVDAGPDVTTYFGSSGDQTVVRTATVSGGTPPYSYSWTMDRPLLCNQVNADGDEQFFGGTCTNNSCPTTGSSTDTALCSGSESITAVLMDTASICVTVIDANGCKVSDCFTVNASDARCFAGNSGNQKILMCHHTNSPNNPWVEICVDPSAVAAHLAQGDYIGPCEGLKMSGIEVHGEEVHVEEFTLDFRIFPNPTSGLVNLEFNGIDQQSYFIELVDRTGRKLATYKGKAIQGLNSKQLSLAGLVPGIYLFKLNLDDEQEVKKLLRK